MNKKKRIYPIDLELDRVFSVGSKVLNKTLKSVILRNNLMMYECAICHLSDIWQNKKLNLQLDHINGLNYDSRLENLRFICPNCHSQTSTFCKGSSTKHIEQAWRRKPRPNGRKVIGRPTKKELLRLIETCNWSEIGRLFDVSDNAVRRWAKSYHII